MSSLATLDRDALKSAVRAAIVTTVVFAFADKVIGNPSTALFAAFGSVALLVMAQFTGPPRTRLLAYLALGCTGAAFITLGTLCSHSPWLAAAGMAVVGFGTLFSGVFSGYFSAGATAAILTFVLPATVPAPTCPFRPGVPAISHEPPVLRPAHHQRVDEGGNSTLPPSIQ